MIIRLCVGVLAAAISLGLLGMFSSGTQAGVVLTATVNSTANTDTDPTDPLGDNDCQGAPNAGVGNCTLHEAIDAVNEGLADVINFHPTTFSLATPGVIDLSSGEGNLPFITEAVVIDAKNRGVVLDGNELADYGLVAAGGTSNGFDFNLNGGKNFVVQDVIDFGIAVCGGTGTSTPPDYDGTLSASDCDDRTLGDVTITGTRVLDNITGDGNFFEFGILVSGAGLNNVHITNNIVDVPDATFFTDGGGISVFAIPVGGTGDLGDNLVDISGNSVLGGQDGVNAVFSGDLSSTIDASVNDNSVITGLTGDGVVMVYDNTSADGVAANDTINFNVDGNGDISSDDTGVGVGTFVDICCDLDNASNTVNVSISGNGNIDNSATGVSGATAGAATGGSWAGDEAGAAGGACKGSCEGEAVGVDVQVCCGDVAPPTTAEAAGGGVAGVGGNTANITVDANDNIAGTADGVFITTFVCCSINNTSDIGVTNNNNISGISDDGVEIDGFAGDDDGVGGDSSDDNVSIVNVSGNNNIDGLGDHGVKADSEAGNVDGEADTNTATIVVDDNGNIDGESDGVEAFSFAGTREDGEGDDNVSSVRVTNNGRIDGNSDDGVDAEADSGAGFDECDETGFSCDARDNLSEVVVSGNVDIDGDSDGVEIDAESSAYEDGAGTDNTVNAHADDNGNISGNEDQGVDIDASSGGGDFECDRLGGCAGRDNVVTITTNNNGNIDGEVDGVEIDGDAGSLCGGEADDNIVTATVNDNGTIATREDDGVDIELESGADLDFCDSFGDADGNSGSATVTGNGFIDGSDGDDGVEIDVDAAAGNDEGDNNTATVNVTANDRIEGDQDGVEVETDAGSTFGDGVDADNNTGTINITDNVEIEGHDDDGIEVAAAAGTTCCNAELGQNNHNVVNITGNGNITGGEGADGIRLIDVIVCCDAANSNTIDVSDNTGDISSLDGDGIDVEPCCSVNVVTITDNAGTISGHGDQSDDNGIEYGSLGEYFDSELVDLERPSLNLLTISGNDVSGSDDDGIQICCGIFAASGAPDQPLKSLITNNTVNGNGADGIDLDTVFGMNVVANTVSGNGTNDGDAGVEVDRYGADFIFDASGGLVVVPANSNRISQNSIFDNFGLGIDLDGDTDFEVDEPSDNESEVGCIPDGAAPIDPNDCIAHPSITLVATGDKVGGTTCAGCHVEVFRADATPADQIGTSPKDAHVGLQHGEGAVYLVTATADALGNFSGILPCGLAAGDLTATTTDKLKNTSEFSHNAPFLATRTCAPPTPTATNTVPSPTPVNTVPSPTPVNTLPPPPPTATATPPKLCGDVNDDGLVNSVDSLLILQLTASLISSLLNEGSGDVNNSGEVSSVDASLILQKEAALILQSGLVCG